MHSASRDAFNRAPLLTCSLAIRLLQIETVLEREREIAKEALKQGNKPRALIALRQRKYQENLLTQTDQQLETLQKLVGHEGPPQGPGRSKAHDSN